MQGSLSIPIGGQPLIAQGADGELSAIVQAVNWLMKRANDTVPQPDESFRWFPVKLTVPTGSSGSATTPCTYTYTVKTLGGVQLATAKSPSQQRTAVGRYIDAKLGIAYYDKDAILIIHWCDEVPGISTCTPCV